MKIQRTHSAAITFVAVLLSGAASIRAEQPARESVDLRRDSSHTVTGHSISGPGALQPTAEMWFYEQERTRHEDPKAAVRRRAEYRAAQRENRIESLRWFGMSNSRPSASVTPFTGTYAPTWAGNSQDWNIWRPVGPTVVVSPKSGY